MSSGGREAIAVSLHAIDRYLQRVATRACDRLDRTRGARLRRAAPSLGGLRLVRRSHHRQLNTARFGLLWKAVAMTHVCCPSCRLRFTRAAAAYIVACPECGGPPQPVPSAQRALGFRLFIDHDRLDALPHAIAVAMPIAALSVKSS